MIWVSVDETYDQEGRHVAAVIVRALEENSTPYMMHTFDLKSTNSDTILRAVDDSLRILSDVIDREHVLVLLTDGAPYMCLAGILFLSKFTNHNV